MTAWWYAKNQKKSGPVESDELMRFLQSGQINPKTLLWKEGMESWLPLDEIDELRRLRTAVPPPLPPRLDPDPLAFPLATRWPRFFARILDAWWEVPLVAYGIGVPLVHFSARFSEWINFPGADRIFPILCLPIALILDASVYRLVGNTPGKALLGLKVGMVNGNTLSFQQYLSRNFSMWAHGAAFGIPFVNLFTMAQQSARLGKHQQASYDEFTGYRVRAKPIGRARKIGFIFAFAALFLGMVVLRTIGSADDDKQSSKIVNFDKAPDQQAQARDILDRRRPNWRDIVGLPDKDGKTPPTPYRAWLAQQPPEYQARINGSSNANEIGDSIDKFNTERQFINLK